MAANSLLYLLLATGLTNPPEDAVTTESNYDVVTRYDYDHTREDAKWRFRWHDETTQDYDVTRPEHSEYTTEDPHDEFVTPSTRGEEDSVFWPFNRKTYEPPHRTVRPEPHRRTERPDPPHRTERPEPPHRTERPEPPHRTERPEPPHRTERPEPPHRTERPEPPHHTKGEKDSVYWSFGNEEETEEPVDVTDENGWPRITEDPEDVTQRPVNKHYRKGEEDSVFWPFNRKTTEPPYRTIRPEPHRRTERPEPHRRTERPEPPHRTERPEPPHRTERPEPPHRTERPEPPHRTERPEPPHHTKGEKDSIYWSFGNEEETEEPVDVTDEIGWPRVTEDPEDATQRPVHKKHKKSGRTCPGKKEYPAYSCDKFCSKKKPCRRSKVKKCVCAGGYARHENGTCVRREFCGKKQMSDFRNTEGCPYEPLCDVYCITNGYDAGHCNGNTCECKEKHAAEPIDSDSCDINSCNFQCALRREGSGKCVGNTCECHKNDGKCPDGETLSDCKGHCQKTCENFLKPMICPDMCIPGCVCAVPGFVRNSKGNCVHRYDCENTHDTDIHEKSEAYKCSVYGCNSDCFTRGKGVGKCENGTCRCERN